MGNRLAVVVGLAFAVGCGHVDAGPLQEGAKGAPSFAEAPAPAEAQAPAMAAPTSAPPPSGTGAGEAAAPRSASHDGAATPAPRERPGLGTEWGETLSSRVHDVAFVRAEPSRPFAMATLHYDDRRGVEALAAYHASAEAPRRDVEAYGGALTVAIEDESGTPLETLDAGDRTYVVGQEGARYTIVVTNHTDHRVEAVATVDGLDVINGRPGKLTNRGYLVLPYATLTIDGFRQSQDAVAAFRFGKVSDSYAAQTGSARNVGVVGVAFFQERGDAFPLPYTSTELRTRDTASPFPGADLRFARPPRR